MAFPCVKKRRRTAKAAQPANNTNEPKRVSARHVLQETRRRMQRQIDLLHMKARYAAEKSATRQNGEGAMAEFQRHWITSKAATFSKHGPRLNVFRPTQHTPAPPEGVHVRVTGAVVPATKRLPRAAGYAMTASDVATDGTETHRLRARGQVQSVSAHAASRSSTPSVLSSRTAVCSTSLICASHAAGPSAAAAVALTAAAPSASSASCAASARAASPSCASALAAAPGCHESCRRSRPGALLRGAARRHARRTSPSARRIAAPLPPPPLHSAPRHARRSRVTIAATPSPSASRSRSAWPPPSTRVKPSSTPPARPSAAASPLPFQ